jgi:hypothetical protein
MIRICGVSHIPFAQDLKIGLQKPIWIFRSVIVRGAHPRDEFKSKDGVVYLSLDPAVMEEDYRGPRTYDFII